MRRPSAELLGPPRFRSFLVARTSALLGAAIGHTCLTVLILERTESVGDVAAVLAAFSAATIAVVVLGGSLADRTSRTRLLRFSHCGSAAVQLATVAVADGYPIGVVAALQFVNGGLTALSYPAARSLAPRLVSKPQLHQSNSWLVLVYELIA